MTAALNKSDVYSSLWAGEDELRGRMNASEYKDYGQALLCGTDVSDKAKAYPCADVEVREGSSLEDLIAPKGNPDLGHPASQSVCLNPELAKKNPGRPEYIERTHSARLIELTDLHTRKLRARRDVLNSDPLAEENREV